MPSLLSFFALFFSFFLFVSIGNQDGNEGHNTDQKGQYERKCGNGEKKKYISSARMTVFYERIDLFFSFRKSHTLFLRFLFYLFSFSSDQRSAFFYIFLTLTVVYRRQALCRRSVIGADGQNEVKTAVLFLGGEHKGGDGGVESDFNLFRLNGLGAVENIL